MPKLSKPIWRLETHCIERHFKHRSRGAFQRIDNSRLKGRVCLRCNDLFLKIAIKRHGRYFSFQNEMDCILKLGEQVWAPRFRRKIEGHRFTIFVYQFYEMSDLKTLLKTRQLRLNTRKTIAGQLRSILSALEKKGIVHRDITPANILFDEVSERVMLIDFQWAREVDEEIQVGSPEEQKMLTYCLSVAGGRYRKPGKLSQPGDSNQPGDPPSGFELDRFSVGKIISELEQTTDRH